jgi:hypothetical protein
MRHREGAFHHPPGAAPDGKGAKGVEGVELLGNREGEIFTAVAGEDQVPHPKMMTRLPDYRRSSSRVGIH